MPTSQRFSVNNQKGAVPLLLLFTGLGLLVFLFISNTFSFKDKLFDQLFPKPPSHASEAESIRGEVVIKFKPGVDNEVKENIRRAHGLEKKHEIAQIGVELNKAPENAKDKIIEALSHNPQVEYAEPNYVSQLLSIPNDPYMVDYDPYANASQPNSWHLYKIAAPLAWDISKGSSDVIVAIIDTGVKGDHEDLVDKLVPGYNFFDYNTDTSDPNGHGTAVAGVVSATSNNSKGVASLGYNVKIMPLRVTGASGSSSSFIVSDALIYAADHGAKIANISLSLGTAAQDMQDAIDYGLSRGLLTVAGAGNSGTASLVYPAGQPGVIGVGMLNGLDQWAGSNYGTALDVMAPGTGLWTTGALGNYVTGSGTSFSSPLTAALAALIFSANPALTPQQVTDIITSTADKVNASTYGGYDSNGWNDHYGFGRINAYKALQMATGIVPVLTSTPSPTPTPTSTLIPSLSPSPIPTSIPSDTTLPTVSITSPSNGSIVKPNSKVTIQASASDNIAISRVEFYQGTTLKCTDTTSSYSCLWSVPGKKNTNYTITVKAYDLSNNTSLANITVKAQ